METKFQTSFIPKKPITSTDASMSNHDHGPSILMILATIIFIISILAVGGAYGWKYYLTGNEQTLGKELKERRDQFNPQLIQTLRDANSKIDIAKGVLTNHLAISQVFGFIERFTSDGIRFMDLDINSPSDGKPTTFSMRGYGPNYKTVAFQSDLFAKLEDLGLRADLSNLMINNPIQNQNGTISFDMTGTINKDSLSYDKLIKSRPQQ